MPVSVRGTKGVPGHDGASRVVGIGASAGGLDAYKQLLAAMPADTGMAFVLIPHLDPSHESLMAELLAKQTAMPVVEARGGMKVRRDHVYVIPPNADLTIAGGVLGVAPPLPRRGAHTAIDVFFRSLAADQRRRAVGIIMSGTGSHGAAGIAAIKAAGGRVLAQTPESCQQPQMPQSAIATGCVDDVLPPALMPAALRRYAAELDANPGDPTPADLAQIVGLLQTQAKRDFRGFRASMVRRRVKRRMGLRHIERGASYVEYLRAHPEEITALGKDLSIVVTAFFREPAAFDVLAREVIPPLLQRGATPDGGDHVVRVWVPGCATGEEAYSLAILFLEQIAALDRPLRLQIFATDIDDESLDVARTGLYPDTIATDVSADRLRRFFIKADKQHYQVSKELRELITFAPQNLMSDAPFSKLHLISCRNVLIYLDPAVQAKVLALFHFALADGGYLLLGPAESLGPAADRFTTVSKKWRVYQRLDTVARRVAEIPILAPPMRSGHALARGAPPRAGAVGDLMHRALLAEFAPAAVLITPQFEILSVQGPVGDFLEFPPGELTRDLLAMARPGLRAAIRSVCQQAIQTQQAAEPATARVRRQAAYAACTVGARLVTGVPGAERLLLVTFQEQQPPPTAPPRPPERASISDDEPALVRQLEHELQATREDLQGTIDELQTSNEELKASHEEVMSMNEELQSTNEEMETSKEELQSLNEELSTVNSQLQDKVHELDAANDDMMNLLASTEIATVFLDAELRIKRYTPPTVKLLNLLPTDLGRPFRDIAPRVRDAALLDACRSVRDTFVPVEAVVRADHAEAYLRRVLPYRTADRRVDGVVITWVDITTRLAAEAESRHFTAVLRDSNDAVALVNLGGQIIGWNRGAERLYGYTEAEARTMRIEALAPELARAATADALARVARGAVASESVETLRTTRDGRTRDVWSTMTLLRDAAGEPDAVVITERDVTEFKEGLAARQTAALYQQVLEHLPAGAVLRADNQLTLNGAAEVITGHSRRDLSSVEAWCAALHGGRAEALRGLYEKRPSDQPHLPPVPLAITRGDGDARHLEFSVSRLDATHDLWMLLDMTAADEAERALRQSEDYLRSVVDTAADAIITIDEHGVMDTFNRAAERMFGYAAAEAIGQNVRLLMPSPHRDEHDHYIARYLETGEARIIGIGREVVGRRKDGTTFPLDLSVSEIDHRRRFTGIMRDLSDRQALEWRLAESQLDERRHMARELHDEVGGYMTGIGLMVQSLQAELERAQSPLTARVGELVHSISDAQQRVRGVIRGLMPVEEIPEGLMAALKALVERYESVSGIPCRFVCDPPVRVDDPTTAKHVFRIVQEALNNAVRHAKASTITVSLERQGPQLQVSVADDGIGLTQPEPGHAGIGLASMRQRAQLLGGGCTAQPHQGGGTIVRCWVPAAPLRPRSRAPRDPGPASFHGAL